MLFLGVSSLNVCAQIDPERRRLLQLGDNQPLEGRGPLSGYAYYYDNRPGFLRTNIAAPLTPSTVPTNRTGCPDYFKADF